MTQVEAARISGVGDKTISALESGARVHRMPIDYLHKLCVAYGIGLAEFFNTGAIFRGEARLNDEEIATPHRMPYERWFEEKGLIR